MHRVRPFGQNNRGLNSRTATHAGMGWSVSIIGLAMLPPGFTNWRTRYLTVVYVDWSVLTDITIIERRPRRFAQC